MASHVPRVSIGIPVYNGERYLAETIDSFLAQTLTDFELVISDNASTDATEEICRRYASRDERIKYFRNEKNIGGSKNFTRVFELSCAPLFKWAAHDDVCLPLYLEKCVQAMEKDPEIILCYPGSGFVDQFGAVIGGGHVAGCHLRDDLPSKRLSQFFVEASTHCFPMYGVIRRENLRKTTLFNPYISGDQILLVQLALQGKFYEVPDQLFLFREHPDRSVWKFKGFAGYATWHDPNRKAGIQLPRWRLITEFFRAVAHTDLPLREAWACHLAVLKKCWWLRDVLLRDLAMAGRQWLAQVRGRPPIEDMKSRIAVPGARGFDGDGLPASIDSSGGTTEKP